MKIFILDANNIIHQDSVLKKLFETSPSGATTGFLHLIEQYCSNYPSYRFHIFFDSVQQLFPKFLAITLYWSSNGEDADSLIKKFVEKTKKNSNVVVVSSDLEIQASAKRFNLSILKSNEFLALLNSKKTSIPSQTSSKPNSTTLTSEKPHRITKREMNEFRELFSTHKK